MSLEPKEIKPSGFTVMNSKNLQNFLVSTDPLPHWKNNIYEKNQKYKQTLKSNLRKNFSEPKFKKSSFRVFKTPSKVDTND